MTAFDSHIGIRSTTGIAIQPVDLVQHPVLVFHHHTNTKIPSPLPIQRPPIAWVATPLHRQQKLRSQRIPYPIHLRHYQPSLVEQFRRRQFTSTLAVGFEKSSLGCRHVPQVGLHRVDEAVDGRPAGTVSVGVAELAEAVGPHVVNEGLGVVPAFGQFEDIPDQVGGTVDVEIDGDVAQSGFEEEGHVESAT